MPSGADDPLPSGRGHGDVTFLPESSAQEIGSSIPGQATPWHAIARGDGRAGSGNIDTPRASLRSETHIFVLPTVWARYTERNNDRTCFWSKVSYQKKTLLWARGSASSNPLYGQRYQQQCVLGIRSATMDRDWSPIASSTRGLPPTKAEHKIIAILRTTPGF